MRLFKINKKRLSYLFFSLGASGLMLLKSALYARLLGVEVFGLYSKYFLLGSMTTAFIGLGYQHYCRVELPGYFSQGDADRVNGTLAASVFAGGIGWLIAVSLAIIFAILSGELGLIHMAIVAVTFGFFYYLFFILLVRFSSEMRLVLSAKGAFLRSSFVTLFGAAAAVLVGSAFGVLLSELIFLVFALLVFLRLTGAGALFGYLFKPDVLAYFLQGCKKSSSLLLLNSAVFVLISLDKWGAAVLLTNEQYGVYAVGLILLAAFDVVQLTVNNAVFPVMSRMSAEEDWKGVKNLANRFGLSFIVLGMVVIWPLWWLSSWLANYLYSNYVGLNSILLLILVTGVLRVANFYSNLVQILGMVRKMLPYYLLIGGLGVVFVGLLLPLSGQNHNIGVFAAFALYLSLALLLINAFAVNRALKEKCM